MFEEYVNTWVETWLEQLRNDEPHPVGNEYVSGSAAYMRYSDNGSINPNRASVTITLRGAPDESLHHAFQQKIESLGGVEVTHCVMPPEGGWPDSWRLEFINIPL